MEVEGTPGARGHPQAPSPRTALSILAPHHQSSSRVCEHLCFILMNITHLLARCVLRCCFFALCHFDLTEGLAGTLLWDSGEPVSFVKEATHPRRSGSSSHAAVCLRLPGLHVHPGLSRMVS